ncbi:MAG: acyl-CoA dehydrogenase family protein, partial [Alphaproteobacteria bacterium]|nr:acyl-CoA dehydrogenase family protein [Alphaproteobacteria bacterium]
MDFSYTEEQTLLRNSVAGYLADKYGFEAWRKFTRSDEGRDPAHWQQFAELGLLAAPLPEAYGGLGGGAIDASVILEEFGKALVVEPYVPTVIVAGGLIARAGTEAQKQEWLNKIATGGTMIAFAFAEQGGRYNLADLQTTAKKQGASFVLNGQKAVVLGGPWADALLVTARTAGARRDEKGVGVFLIDKKTKGVGVRDYPTVDGARASEVTFENAEIPADR